MGRQKGAARDDRIHTHMDYETFQKGVLPDHRAQIHMDYGMPTGRMGASRDDTAEAHMDYEMPSAGCAIRYSLDPYGL